MPLVFSQPILSVESAHFFSFFFAFSYVGSLYISKTARLSFSKPSGPHKVDGPRQRLSNERWRDDPDVIKARLVAVGFSSITSCAIVGLILWNRLGFAKETLPVAIQAAAVRLGLLPRLGTSIYPHLVTPVLFLGPLHASYLNGVLPFQKYWNFKRNFIDKFFTWVGLRNYSLAPITEELVFRACVLSVYHLAGASRKRMILFSPLAFGLAHVHHAWDTYNRYGRTQAALKRALLGSLFQLLYTSVFGFLCSYLFLRTGSIYPPVSAHIFCNIMGLPQLVDELKQFPRRRTTIIISYILGVVGFWYTLPRWTKTDGSLLWYSNSASARHSRGSY